MTQPGHLPPVQSCSGHEHTGVADVEPLPDRLRTERREERARNRTMLQRSENTDVELGAPPEQEEDSVGSTDAESVECVGEPTGRLRELDIREVADSAAPTQEAQRYVRRPSARSMAVHALMRDVQTAGARQAVEASSGLLPGERIPGDLVVDEIGRHRPVVNCLDDLVGPHAGLILRDPAFDR